jgi:hypothetical protein
MRKTIITLLLLVTLPAIAANVIKQAKENIKKGSNLEQTEKSLLEEAAKSETKHADKIECMRLAVECNIKMNEAENMKQEQFGDDHMLDILRHTKFKDARHVVEMMEAEVKRHRQGAESNDDMTIMCLKALRIEN